MKLSEIGAKNDMPRGWVRQCTLHLKIYEMWRGMLRRCSCTTDDSDYKYYKDCTVHTDFLLLSNFVNWIEQEPNYPLLVEDPGCNKWSIDKDMIVKGNKEYTYGKMQLITKSDNSKDANTRIDHTKCNVNNRKPIIAISIKNPLGMLFYKSIFSVQYDGFDPSYVSRCCRGLTQYSYGYKWYYITNLEVL